MSGIDQHLAKNTAEVRAKGHLKMLTVTDNRVASR